MAVVLATVLASTLTTFASSTAVAETVDREAEFATLINQARRSTGLAELTIHTKLSEGARDWSVKMSEASGANLGRACQLSHNPRLAKEVQLNWETIGENVGCGANTVEAVHEAFMNSPTHRRNILDPKFDSVGVAIATSGTTMFVTEVFMQTKIAAEKSTTKASKKSGRKTAKLANRVTWTRVIRWV